PICGPERDQALLEPHDRLVNELVVTDRVVIDFSLLDAHEVSGDLRSLRRRAQEAGEEARLEVVVGQDARDLVLDTHAEDVEHDLSASLDTRVLARSQGAHDSTVVEVGHALDAAGHVGLVVDLVEPPLNLVTVDETDL